MDITFASKKFQKIVNDDRIIVRELGKIRAEKVRAGLVRLRFAKMLEDVRALPGNYHELTDDRKGQWTFDLKMLIQMILTMKLLVVHLKSALSLRRKCIKKWSH